MASPASQKNSYVRVTATGTANTGSANFVAQIYAERNLRSISGSLRLGAASHTTTISHGQCSQGTLLGSISLNNVPYDQDNGTTAAASVAFTGTVSYSDEEDDYTGVNANIGVFYVSVTNPVQTKITTNKNSYTLGETVTITTSGGTSSSPLTWQIGSNSGNVVSGNVGNTSTSWALTLNTYALYITSGSSATCKISWNGLTKSITLNVPNNSNTVPTVSTVTMSVAEPSGWSAWVQSKGKAKATISASAKLGASISSYTVTMNGETLTSSSNEVTSGYLASSGSNTCTVTVTDSRGFTSSSKSATFTVAAYSTPRLSSVSIYRSDSSGNAKNDGTYITYKFTPTISAVGSNAKKYRLAYRQQGASSWTWWAAEANLGSYTAAQTFIMGGNLSATQIFETYLYIKDSFETVSTDIGTVPGADVIMDFNLAGTGGGIGMYTQAADRLDVAWKIKANGGLNIPFTGTGVTSTTYVAVFDGNKDIRPMNVSYITPTPPSPSQTVTLTKLANEKSGVSCTSSYKYGGLSITIPANSAFSFEFWTYYDSVQPGGVILSESSTSITGGNCRVEAIRESMPNAPRVVANFSGYNDSSSDKIYYLWGKTSGSSGNIGFQYAGFAIKVVQ